MTIIIFFYILRAVSHRTQTISAEDHIFIILKEFCLKKESPLKFDVPESFLKDRRRYFDHFSFESLFSEIIASLIKEA